ncbi:MAG: hypothetical protein JXA10_03675 [Anaerolineae bacterium]|nr:hypothetical protein [Anaerolineae bacterium]
MTLPRLLSSNPLSSDRITGQRIFLAGLAVALAAFLLGVGLGANRLPFPPEAEFSDAVTSHWPNALFLRESVMEDHTWPLWRSWHMSGQPFAANPLNKVWYPPQWIVFVLPPILHLNVLIWLHLLIAGAGAWRWSRATGLTPYPAALVGFGYAFAPRVIAAVGAGHLDLVDAAAWVPWLLWATYGFIQHNDTENTANQSGEVDGHTPHKAQRYTSWLAGFAALCFLADVRLSAYAFVTTAAYLVWLWWQVPELRARTALFRLTARLGFAGLLMLGLTAFQWIPLLLMRGDLSRNAMSLDDAAINSLKPGQWIGLLIGDHGGSWETMVYVGVSVLILAIVALLLRPRKFAFWGIVVLVLMLYAMGDQFVFWPALNRLFPFLRWWRVPPRVWLIAALILPYLAGWGVQLLIESPPDRKSVRLGVVALLGGGLVCGVFSTITLSSTLDLTALIGIFALPITALIMLLAILRKLPAQALLIALLAIVFLDVLWIDRTLIEGRDQDEWLEPYRELAEYLQEADATRVYSPSYSLPQQAATYWQIAQFDGVDPFQLATYVDAAEVATGVQASGYSVTIPAFAVEADANENFDSQTAILANANRGAPIQLELLGQWLVTHVVTAFEIETEGLELDTKIGDVYVYRNTFAPDVTLVWAGPNRVTIRAEEPLTGPLYAVANGRWQNRSSSDSPGLPGTIAGSTQEWTFEYDPSELWYSALAAGVLITLAGGIWWGALRERSGHDH